MKFDYIVMNPPYTVPGDSKLHYRFLQKACEIAETVVSIQPDTWLYNERKNPVLDLKGRGVDIDVIGDTEHLFGKKTNLGYKLSITRIDKRIKGIMMKWDGRDRTKPVGSFAELDPSKRYGDMLSKIKAAGMPADSLMDHIYGAGGGGGGAKASNRITDPSMLKDKWIVRLATIIPNRERRPNNFGLLGIDPNRPAVFRHDGKAAGMPADSLMDHVYGAGGGGGGAKASNRITDPSVLNGKWIVRLATIVPNRERHPNNFGLLGIDPNRPAVFRHDGVGLIGRAYCMFDTEEEAKNCYRYLASDAVRAFVILYKTGSATYKAIQYIPWPAGDRPFLTGDWSNEAVSDRFGLDQKEREWLAEILPDCYHVR